MVRAEIQELARLYRRRHEEVWFAIYTLALIVSSLGISSFITEAATSPGGLEGTIDNSLQAMGLVIVDLGAFFLGFHLTLIAVLFLDHKKRAQSILIAVGTLIGLVSMLFAGVFFAWFDAIALVLVLFGVVFGTMVAGWSELRRIEIGDPAALARGRIYSGQGQDPIEFPRAERALYAVMSVVVIIGLIDANTRFPALVVLSNGIPLPNLDAVGAFEIVQPGVGTAVGLASTLIFLTALWMFIGYKAERSVVVLGPPGSGKTHLYLGLYREATNQKMHPRGDYEISRLQSEMRRNRGFVGRTREQQALGFTYTVGSYFPKDISLQANDYPGEYFYHIADGIKYHLGALTAEDYENNIRADIQEGRAIKEGQSSADVLDQRWTDGGAAVNDDTNSTRASLASDDSDSDDDDDADTDSMGESARRREVVGEQIVPDVVRADILVFVIDMKVKSQEVEADAGSSMDINGEIGETEFKQILTALSNAGGSRDVKLVATKSDYLLDEFEETYPGIDIWSDGYEQFRKYVDRVMSQGRGSDIKERVWEMPYPVLYETDKDNEERDEELVLRQGDPLLYGFDRVLKRLGR